MSYFFDDLREHPDTIELEVAGQPVPWLLTKSAFEAAEEEGHSMADFQNLEEEDVQGNLDALATLLWIGTRPFDLDVSKAEFDEILTPRVAGEVAPRVMAQFEGLADEEVEDVVGKE